MEGPKQQRQEGQRPCPGPVDVCPAGKPHSLPSQALQGLAPRWRGRTHSRHISGRREQGPQRQRARAGKHSGWERRGALRLEEGGRLRRVTTSTFSEITVSPQHPCEVGWKVATIVMPTSQTRLGHSGARARAAGGQGVTPVGGLGPGGSPHPQQASADPTQGPPATQSLGHGEKYHGFKTPRTKGTKIKKVMQRGENKLFFPKWPGLSE